MVVSSCFTPHHPRHYMVDYRRGGTSGCTGFARRNVYEYALQQGHLSRHLCLRGGLLLSSYIPAQTTLLKSTHLLHLETVSKA
eukprot:9022661-Pyramimonas_sp.AAC.1